MIQALQPLCADALQSRHITLLNAVMQAHSDEAGAMPFSTVSVSAIGEMGQSFESAFSVGLAGIAPATKARGFWFYELGILEHNKWADALREAAQNKLRISGFNFDGKSPDYSEIKKAVSLFPAAESAMIDAAVIVRELHPTASPNLTFYTALAAELCKMNYGIESSITILSRTTILAMAWGQGVVKAQNG